MKDCRECEYFKGWDYSDGTPNCEYEGGYTACPFCDEASTKKNGMKIEIEVDFLTDYIRHTLQNTAHSAAVSIAEREVRAIIDDTTKGAVKKATEEAIRCQVDKQVAEYLAGDITIGGGWCEPQRTLPREQYMAELIQKELDANFRSNAIKSQISEIARAEIKRFAKGLRDDINRSIKECFNAATRQALTENVVSMLMSNDTYQRLSNSMNSFLPTKNEKEK